jgi:putative ABC transport system permease protein
LDWQIVGVVRAVRSARMRRDNPEVLVPFWQLPWPSAYVTLAVPRTMEQVQNMVLANDRFTAMLFTSFAAVALLLCALGVYGVMAFSVAQRSREIGLRIALGAGRSRILSLVLSEGLTLACIGWVLGLIGAYLVGRAMRTMLYGIAAIDPIEAFITITLVLLAVAMLACYPPARRAASIEPMDALRTEYE